MAAERQRTTVPAPRRRVVDGLNVYVVDAPPPARCALMFRVGRVDETLPTAGISHMVEHLALFRMLNSNCRLNGFVDANRTVFHAAGTEEECIEFLDTVTSSIADLPMQRLDQERQVLDAEEQGRGHGLFDSLVTYRFGARGFGLLGCQQFGLFTLRPQHLERWTGDRFTSGNAVLLLSGVDPERVSHSLPDGHHWPIPEPEVVDDELPAWFENGSGGVGLSMVARRSPALEVGLRLLHKRLFNRLRTELAIVYDVLIDVQAVDVDIAHVTLGCQTIEGRIDEARAAIDVELARLAGDGPTEDEMEADSVARERSWAEPEAVVSAAHRYAVDQLFGVTPLTPAKLLQAQRSVTGADVAGAVAVARQTALWALPSGATVPDDLRRAAHSSARRLEGRHLVHKPVDGDAADEHLVVGDGGIGVERSDGSHIHVEYERCAAALAWRDGTRVLFGDDGFSVTVRPWEWTDGGTAVAEIDAKIGDDLMIPMGDGGGPPDQVAPATASLGPKIHALAFRLLVVLFVMGTVIRFVRAFG